MLRYCMIVKKGQFIQSKWLSVRVMLKGWEEHHSINKQDLDLLLRADRGLVCYGIKYVLPILKMRCRLSH